MTTRDQYRAASEKYPNSVLFFKVGNAYEAYHGDATLCNIELDRPIRPGQFFPVVEIPSNQIDAVIGRLIRYGYNCALIDGDCNTLPPGEPTTPEDALAIIVAWPEANGLECAVAKNVSTAHPNRPRWIISVDGITTVLSQHGDSFAETAERIRMNLVARKDQS
jgi:hypothetical protein